MKRLLLVLVALLARPDHLMAESAARRPSGLTIQVVTGDEPLGSLANSVLVYGSRELLLVDAQRTCDNARKVAQAVRATGRKLTTVFITHSHPDHMLGSAIIRQQFPDARFVATPAVAGEMKSTAESTRQLVKKALQATGAQDQIPDSVVVPEPLETGVIDLEGTRIEVIEQSPAESRCAAMLHIPSMGTLIAGDVVFNGVHLWLNEKRFEDWARSLRDLRRMKRVQVIYPGHGEKTDRSAIDAGIRYIRDYQVAARSSKTAGEAARTMRTLYPDHKLDRFLTYGLDHYFESPPADDRSARPQDGAVGVSHVGVAVDDLDRAIAWYSDVLGFQLMSPPISIDADVSPLGPIARSLFGQDVKNLRIAQLRAGNHVGIELFQFVKPRTDPHARGGQRKTGFLHLAITGRDVEAVVRKVERSGGRLVVRGATNPARTVVFCQDPDGNVIEISSRSWDGM